MKKRACAWILALGLVFCQMPQTAWAAEAGKEAPGTEITEVTDNEETAEEADETEVSKDGTEDAALTPEGSESNAEEKAGEAEAEAEAVEDSREEAGDGEEQDVSTDDAREADTPGDDVSEPDTSKEDAEEEAAKPEAPSDDTDRTVPETEDTEEADAAKEDASNPEGPAEVQDDSVESEEAQTPALGEQDGDRSAIIIDSVSINITAPEAGTGSTNAESAVSTSTPGLSVESATWKGYKGYSTYEPSEMTFVEGETYFVVIDLKAADGYTFKYGQGISLDIDACGVEFGGEVVINGGTLDTAHYVSENASYGNRNHMYIWARVTAAPEGPHTVTFVTDGRYAVPSAQTVQPGGKAAQPDHPTQFPSADDATDGSGLHFQAWYTEPVSPDMTYADLWKDNQSGGKIFWFNGTVITEDTTLYAGWWGTLEAETYDVTRNQDMSGGRAKVSSVYTPNAYWSRSQGPSVFADTNATVSAKADPYYAFVGWSTSRSRDDIISTESEYTFKFEKRTKLYALFEDATCYLCTGLSDGGKMSTAAGPDPSDVSDYGMQNMALTKGDPVTLTATPDQGYVFNGFYEGIRQTDPNDPYVGFVTDYDPAKLLSNEAVYTFTISGNTNVYALFEKCSAHVWDAGVVTVQPTCTKAGVKEYTCQRCGVKKQEAVPTVAHKAVIIPAKAATETSTGLTEGKKCSVCGTILTAQKTIPVLPPQKAADGTTVGTGASETTATKSITTTKSEEGPKGTKFNLLQAQQKKVNQTSISIKWKKIKGAKYIIYGAACGKKYKKIKTVSGTSYTQKKLKKGKYYKYIVMAVKDGKVVSTSKTIHVATTGGKIGNAAKVTMKKSLSLKKGKTATLKAAVTNGKLKVHNHRKVSWESSNPAVATVRNGKVKAVGKGKAVIYAYAQNGRAAKCTVTVK
ncbi:MAG: Ig-like domain-containing protein [Eubacteriales bacterium]|nr:Ig-like domain-containing protein [Eubacteriales bacterium]